MNITKIDEYAGEGYRDIVSIIYHEDSNSLGVPIAAQIIKDRYESSGKISRIESITLDMSSLYELKEHLVNHLKS